MTASTTALPASTGVTTPAFWERLWRLSGIISVVCVLIAYVVYGHQPSVGTSPEALLAFYNGNRTRILISTVFSGNAVLFLLWFAAALRTTLADAGEDGWGAAATAASAVVAVLFLLLTSVGAVLAYSVAGAGNSALTSGLNDFVWACVVLSSYPRAMLVMAGTFGLWRAGLISNALFAVGVAAVVLVLLGGMTWMSAGFWAPDGVYSRLVAPIVGLTWVVFVSGFLLSRGPVARAGW
jgi:hypothetical protein